jgi:phosphatidylglycerophosphate synthase
MNRTVASSVQLVEGMRRWRPQRKCGRSGWRALITGMEAAVQTARTAPLIGLIAEVALLAALAHTAGLSAIGWSVGLLCAVALNVLLTRALARSRATTFGPANWVTLARSSLVIAVAALMADAFVRPAPLTAIVTLTVIALFLDAIDGRVARRTGSVTALGARFDMEVDAFLIVVLSSYVAHSLGLWVLAIGAARYAFVAASWLLPWLRECPPPRFRYKLIAAIQGIVLTIAIADILPRAVTVVVLMLALVLLSESFAHEVRWLWQHGGTSPSRSTQPRRIVVVCAETRPAVGVSE